MAVITTYVCDITGHSSQDKSDFVEVTITSKSYSKPTTSSTYGVDKDGYTWAAGKAVTKFISKEAAVKLHLGAYLPKPEENPNPVPSFESQIATLIRDYVTEIAVDEAVSAVTQRG